MDSQASAVYRPDIFRSNIADDIRRMELLRNTPGIEWLDTLDAQIADLVRTRHPSRRLSQTELADAVAGFPGYASGTYGCWVYYPWSRRVIRLLCEPDFIELRTDRNKHKITAAEQASLSRRRIGIVGLSVGQSVALTIAMERSCGQLRLADFDTIDLSNLNRLRCGLHNLGLSKTVSAAREIAELDPFLDVVCFNDGYTALTEAGFMEGLDLVVDECDSLDVKVSIRERARSLGISVLMSTSDRGTIDIERFDLERTRPLFHGRVDGLSLDSLGALTTEQKIPVLMKLANLPEASLRMRASLVEIGQTILTWPQLASDVTFGGAAVCDVARRVLLGQPVASGCFRMDFETLGGMDLAPESRPEESEWTARSQRRSGNVVEAILLDAIQAPSAANDQPWRWQRTDNGLELSLRDLKRHGSLYADRRADLIGAGATFETALISARQHGFDVTEKLDADNGLIAHMNLSPASSQGDEPLYRQIERRRSNRSRQPGASTIAEDAEARLFDAIARFPDIRMTLLTSATHIAAAAEIAGEADRLRILDAACHSDLIREICWSEAEHLARREAIPLTALGLSEGDMAGLHLLRDPSVVATLEDWKAGSGLGRISRELIGTSSAVGLLWSLSDEPTSYFTGGRALQRLWLQATAESIGLCPVTTVCYLLRNWRNGGRVTDLQRASLPDLDIRLRQLFDLPESRADLVMFRLVGSDEDLSVPRPTLRLPLDVQSGSGFASRQEFSHNA